MSRRYQELLGGVSFNIRWDKLLWASGESTFTDPMSDSRGLWIAVSTAKSSLAIVAVNDNTYNIIYESGSDTFNNVTLTISNNRLSVALVNFNNAGFYIAKI